MEKPVNIKNTIAYICSIFRFFGIGNITAEDFRLAKFNKHPNIEKLIHLLFQLIYHDLTDFSDLKEKNAKSTSLQQMKLFIFYYLEKSGSPFVQEIENSIKVVDFGSSRNVILMIA